MFLWRTEKKSINNHKLLTICVSLILMIFIINIIINSYTV